MLNTFRGLKRQKMLWANGKAKNENVQTSEEAKVNKRKQVKKEKISLKQLLR